VQYRQAQMQMRQSLRKSFASTVSSNLRQTASLILPVLCAIPVEESSLDHSNYLSKSKLGRQPLSNLAKDHQVSQTSRLPQHYDSSSHFEAPNRDCFPSRPTQSCRKVRSPASSNDWTGSRMVIPSLEALSPNWPTHKNPWLEHIRADFTSWANM
jgi:hypothetical protein